MRVEQASWTMVRSERRRAPWPLRKDLLAVLMLCAIFGLEILALMQTTGGAVAYSMAASEGMQVPLTDGGE